MVISCYLNVDDCGKTSRASCFKIGLKLSNVLVLAC